MSGFFPTLLGLFALGTLLLPPHVYSAGRADSWQVLAAAAGGATFYQPSGLAVDPTGDLYVADVGNSRVVEISPGARLLHQWQVPPFAKLAAAGYVASHVALARDKRGYVYLGNLRWHHVYRLSPTGQARVFGPSFGTSAGVAVGPRGNVFVADSDAGDVLKLDPSGHVLNVWPVPDPQKSTSSTLEAVAVDARGTVYVSMSMYVPQDLTTCEKYCWGGTVYHWIETLSYAGKVTGSWEWDTCVEGVMSPYQCGSASVTATPLGLVAAAGPDEKALHENPGDRTVTEDFGWISGLATDVHGHIYVSDAARGTVTELSAQGKVLGQWGGGAVLGLFQCPEAVAADSNGNIFVDDVENGRVVKLTSTGWAVTSWPVSGPVVGEASYGCGSPHSIAIDEVGHVYLLDSGARALRVYSERGESRGLRYISGFGPSWFEVSAVAVGPNGNLLAAGYDATGDLVMKVSPNGSVLSTARVDLDQTTGVLGGIAVDRDGNVYLSGSYASMIVKLSPELRIVARWTGFSDPAGLAVDARGNLYVADTGLYRGPRAKRGQGIFELSPTGKIVARWEAVGSNPGQFRQPRDVAVDGQGDLIVADTGNNRVQRLAHR